MLVALLDFLRFYQCALYQRTADSLRLDPLSFRLSLTSVIPSLFCIRFFRIIPILSFLSLVICPQASNGQTPGVGNSPCGVDVPRFPIFEKFCADKAAWIQKDLEIPPVQLPAIFTSQDGGPTAEQIGKLVPDLFPPDLAKIVQNQVLANLSAILTLPTDNCSEYKVGICWCGGFRFGVAEQGRVPVQIIEATSDTFRNTIAVDLGMLDALKTLQWVLNPQAVGPELRFQQQLAGQVPTNAREQVREALVSLRRAKGTLAKESSLSLAVRDGCVDDSAAGQKISTHITRTLVVDPNSLTGALTGGIAQAVPGINMLDPSGLSFGGSPGSLGMSLLIPKSFNRKRGLPIFASTSAVRFATLDSKICAANPAACGAVEPAMTQVVSRSMGLALANPMACELQDIGTSHKDDDGNHDLVSGVDEVANLPRQAEVPYNPACYRRGGEFSYNFTQCVKNSDGFVDSALVAMAKGADQACLMQPNAFYNFVNYGSREREEDVRSVAFKNQAPGEMEGDMMRPISGPPGLMRWQAQRSSAGKSCTPVELWPRDLGIGRVGEVVNTPIIALHYKDVLSCGCGDPRGGIMAGIEDRAPTIVAIPRVPNRRGEQCQGELAP